MTYLIKQDSTEYILRRGPHGATVKSGHDMHREFKILTKLKQVYSKVPKTIHYCEDKSIIGAPFYLMERVRGVIFGAIINDELISTKGNTKNRGQFYRKF